MYVFKNKVFIGWLLVFVVVIFAWQLRSAGVLTTTQTKLTDSEYVSIKNEAFRKGYDLLSKEEYSAASLAFKESLSEAQNISQESYIKNYLGIALGLNGNYEEAILELKSVADNENYPDTQRAYAVSFLGELFYRSNEDPYITKLVFSTAPYKNFLVPGDKHASYRNVFEYALNFYPVSSAMYRVAVSEFYEVAPLVSKKESTPKDLAKIDQFWQRLDQVHLLLTDEMSLVERLNYSSGSKSELYLKEANINAMSTLLGKNKITEAEEGFRNALNLSGLSKEQELRISYYYALFLSQLKDSRREGEIRNLLSLFDDPSYHNNAFYKFFFLDRAKQDQRMSLAVKRIAEVDEIFAKKMKDSGWQL